jgi:hypothetical protein
LSDPKPIHEDAFFSETVLCSVFSMTFHDFQSRAPCGGKHHLGIAAVHQTAQSENATYAEELVLDGINGVQHSIQVKENHLVVWDLQHIFKVSWLKDGKTMQTMPLEDQGPDERNLTCINKLRYVLCP